MEIQWSKMIVCTLLCALLGVMCIRIMKRMLSKRFREYTLSPAMDRLVCLGMAACGGLIGALTSSYFLCAYYIILLCICVMVSIIDWTHQLIPNDLVLAIFLLAGVFGIPSLLNMKGFPDFHLVSSLIGMAACFVVFLLPGLLGKHVGAGDVKLAAAMGFLVGIDYALIGIVMMGLMMLGYLVIQKRMPIVAILKSNIPMGPFIACGMFAAVFGVPYLL